MPNSTKRKGLHSRFHGSGIKGISGKGLYEKVLEQPFAEARKLGILCVLDTDTPLKVTKYEKCGMKNTGKKALKSGACLYTMEYR